MVRIGVPRGTATRRLTRRPPRPRAWRGLVVAEYALGSLVGLVDNLAGRIELDPFLKPREWGASG